MAMGSGFNSSFELLVHPVLAALQDTVWKFSALSLHENSTEESKQEFRGTQETMIVPWITRAVGLYGYTSTVQAGRLQCQDKGDSLAAEEATPQLGIARSCE